MQLMMMFLLAEGKAKNSGLRRHHKRLKIARVFHRPFNHKHIVKLKQSKYHSELVRMRSFERAIVCVRTYKNYVSHNMFLNLPLSGDFSGRDDTVPLA